MEHINPPRRRILAASSVLSAAALTGCTPDGLFSRPLGGAPRPSQPGACLPADAALPDGIDDQGTAITPDGPQHDPPDLFRGALDLSGDGAILAAPEQSGTPAAETPGVILWSTADRALRTRLKYGPTGPLAFSPSDDLLALGIGGRTALVGIDGTQQRSLISYGPDDGQFAHAVDIAWSPSGEQLAVLVTDGSIRLWDLTADACPHEQVISTDLTRPSRIVYSPDGAWIAAGAAGSRSSEESGPRIQVRSAADGTIANSIAHTLQDLGGRSYGFDYGADGMLIVVHDAAPTAVVLAPDGTSSEGPDAGAGAFSAVAAAPSGSQTAVWDEETITLWDRASDSVERLGNPGFRTLVWGTDDALHALDLEEGAAVWTGSTWQRYASP